MINNVLIWFALGGFLLGGVIGWIAKPVPEVQKIDTTKYELEAKIQELEYQHKIDSIEHKHTTDFMHFENGDSTYRDSILISLGY